MNIIRRNPMPYEELDTLAESADWTQRSTNSCRAQQPKGL